LVLAIRLVDTLLALVLVIRTGKHRAGNPLHSPTQQKAYLPGGGTGGAKTSPSSLREETTQKKQPAGLSLKGVKNA